ncbi:MAG: hypothetical protein J0J15_28110, partial [Mesorhizobium sp.]|nr:hypothetical protein [Mesorhizobium sp.]
RADEAALRAALARGGDTGMDEPAATRSHRVAYVNVSGGQGTQRNALAPVCFADRFWLIRNSHPAFKERIKGRSRSGIARANIGG